MGCAAMMRGPTLVLVLATWFANSAGAQVQAVDLYAPRAFGYVIGDVIEHEVKIALAPPFTLEPASLPQPRTLNYWLDLQRVRLDDHGTRGGSHRYTLHLAYQTFYAPLEPKRLVIPALTLTASNEEQRANIAVPEWSFIASPLREVVATGSRVEGAGQAMRLQPDVEPRPIPTVSMSFALAASGTVGLLALAALAWQLGWWPFRAARRRPFAQAARTVRKLASSSTSSAYRAALVTLHRAFDTTAGRGVFAEDLPAFLTAHPAFRSGEVEVTRLFAASRQAFFGNDLDGAIGVLPPEQLVVIARRLRSIERGA